MTKKRSNKLFELVITAIVVKDNKFLIGKRSEEEDKFPGMWTVPGGKLHLSDYTEGEKGTSHYWYNVIGGALKREVTEEAGVEIENIRYVTSLADNPRDRYPSVVLSMIADYKEGKLCPNYELVEFAWISLSQAKKFNLIEGIYEELKQAESLLRGERVSWKKE
jgi:8-oxo-dGTP pyrophosphatase MutT (NUDIX family)